MADIFITLETDGMEKLIVRIPVYPSITELSKDGRALLLAELAEMASNAIQHIAKSKPWMSEWETRTAA